MDQKPEWEEFNMDWNWATGTYLRRRITSAGEEWQQKVSRYFSIDFMNIDDAIEVLRKAGEGLVDVLIDGATKDYQVCMSVVGWAPDVPEKIIQKVVAWSTENERREKERALTHAKTQLTRLLKTYPQLFD